MACSEALLPLTCRTVPALCRMLSVPRGPAFLPSVHQEPGHCRAPCEAGSSRRDVVPDPRSSDWWGQIRAMLPLHRAPCGCHRAACRAPSRATERARASQGCGSIRHSTHGGGRGAGRCFQLCTAPEEVHASRFVNCCRKQGLRPTINKKRFGEKIIARRLVRGTKGKPSSPGHGVGLRGCVDASPW